MDLASDHVMTIDGAPVRGSETFAVVNPATGEAFATAPDCSAAELNDAVAAATRAYRKWRS